jgi:hypothetical protein
MDYPYYVKDKGPVDQELLNNLIELVMKQDVTVIPRFSDENKVLGLVHKQITEIDKAVIELKATLVVPEIVGNPFGDYFTIHRLPPRSKIHEHSDITNGVSWDDLWTHKLHIPLKTNPNAKFGFRRNLNSPVEWMHLKQGHLYMYNNLAFHQVVNNSHDEERIHLIMYAPDRKMKAHYDTNLNKRAPAQPT